MKSRCPHCNHGVGHASRRCEKCGALVAHKGPLELVTLARPAAPYASGDRVADRYLVLEAHGVGPLGTTYRARDPEGRTVAVKVVPAALLPTSAERDAFVASFAQLRGRAIERVSMPADVGIDAGGVVFVVSPWVFGTSLRRVLRAYRAAERRLEADQALGVLQGAAAALRELHTTSSHGALYPENIQITSDSVVLTDPGLAAALPSNRFAAHMEHHPDALPYIAPEVRAGKRCNAGGDLFSLGALASELLFGDPFATASGARLPDTPDELAEALHALVALQPARRAGALPLVLERLARVASPASLPAYAPLPAPAPSTEARTRRVQAMSIAAPAAAIAPIAPRTPDEAAGERPKRAPRAEVPPSREPR